MEPGDESARHEPVKHELDEEEIALQAEMQETYKCLPSRQHAQQKFKAL